jgi:hypothetical protein
MNIILIKINILQIKIFLIIEAKMQLIIIPHCKYKEEMKIIIKDNNIRILLEQVDKFLLVICHFLLQKHN